MKGQPKFFLPVILMLSLLLYGAVSSATAVSSCVTCHTNESLMKSLHKPPPMPEGESGEG